MKILFITRKYPPQIGGMEKYSYNLIKYFPSDKKVIFLNKPQWHLIWFLPYAFLKALLMLQKAKKRKNEKFDLIYLCDALLAPLGALLKKISKTPTAITCHGLDVTYPHWWYQKTILFALKKLDKIICVSTATYQECVKRGLSPKKLVFIPNGVEIKPQTQNLKFKTTNKILKLQNCKIDLQSHFILLTVGRLVKRKGVAWFIEQVMTQLPKNIIYLVVGTGPERKNIENLINKYHLENQVFILGKLSDEDLKKVYLVSDVFVMPNQKIPGDIEGFGLVALEATNFGLPVIASNLEGISDAIKDGQNGILVPPQNSKEFIRQINILQKDPEKKEALILRAQKYNKENYHWEKIVKKYYQELRYLLQE